MFSMTFIDMSGEFELWKKKSWKIFCGKNARFLFWNNFASFSNVIMKEKNGKRKFIGKNKGDFSHFEK